MTTSSLKAMGQTMLGHALDHVALWVADRDELAAFGCRHLGMHEIERTSDFTLVGADARKGKLTLFAAEGPRERGPLERVVLRVPSLAQALEKLPRELAVERPRTGLAHFEGPQGLRLGLVQSPEAIAYDIDHVVLRVHDPARTREELARLGFARDGNGLVAGDKRLVLEQGDPDQGGRPLLNHLALLVDSGRALLEQAKQQELEILDIRDTANTFAVFVQGPDGIQLEYVEHKPSFSLD